MAEITYESICNKLGFRPFIDDYDIPVNDFEDDLWESPFRALSSEELSYLLEYYKVKVANVE